MDERKSTPNPRQGSDSREAAPTPRRASEGGAGVFHQAVAVLQARHDVTEMDAYEMLVEGAADAGTSVREVAHAVLANSPGGPPAHDGLSDINRSRVTSRVK